MARAAPRPATLVHTPGAGHAQVRVQREVALEANQQMLAARPRAANRATRESLGPTVGLMARLRGEDLNRHMARERRIDALSGMVDGVALGHPCKDAPTVISQTVLVVAGPFGDRLGAGDVARAIGDGLMAGGLPEPDLCPLDEGSPGASSGGSPDEVRARLEALDFDARMRRARAVVLAERHLTQDSLRGSATFEIATRARQGGVPAYAVTGENVLDPFDARILDLQVILEASPTKRALLAAGTKLTQAI
jgi:Glycerate kinase family